LEDIDELIKNYGLESDAEYVIIPFTDKNGNKKRCFILKRRFIRVIYADGAYVDYPLKEIVEAIMKYPELPLSESLYMMQKEKDAETGEN
jgi:hypothetical protein